MPAWNVVAHRPHCWEKVVVAWWNITVSVRRFWINKFVKSWHIRLPIRLPVWYIKFRPAKSSSSACAGRRALTSVSWHSARFCSSTNSVCVHCRYGSSSKVFMRVIVCQRTGKVNRLIGHILLPKRDAQNKQQRNAQLCCNSQQSKQ